MCLWGEKTVSWFDVWSIEDFIAGISIGGLWLRAGRCRGAGRAPRKSAYLLGILATALLWELVEYCIEAGYVWDRATYWMQGIEFIGNRFITDPLLVIAGSLVAWRRSGQAMFASMFSTVWVSLHVFAFPHCMYLQDQLSTWMGSPPKVPSYLEWVKEKPPHPPCPIIRKNSHRPVTGKELDGKPVVEASE